MRRTNTVWFHLYVKLTNQTNDKTWTELKQTHRYREQSAGHQKGARGAQGKTGEGDYEPQTFSCKIIKSWGYNLHHQ